MRPLIVLAIWTMATPPIAINGVVAGIKWNKRLQDFEPIPGLSSQEVEKQERFRRSRQEETHDFKGELMRISFYEAPGFFEFYDNDTKARGICGDIWNVLSEYLNFTLVVEKSENHSVGFLSENGTYVEGALKYAQLNQIDIVPKLEAYAVRLDAVNFSPVLWMMRQRIYTRARWNPNRHWMFDVFNAKAWYLVSIFVAVLSVASLVTEKVLTERTGQKLQTRSFFVHLFHTFSTLCNQGNPSDDGDNGSRMVNLTVRIFGWLTLVAYNSRLITSLTQEVFIAPFNDLPTLVKKTKIQILVLEGSFSHAVFSSPSTDELFRDIKGAGRVTVEKNLDDMYRKACIESDKYVLFDEDDAMATRGITFCKLVPVGEAYNLAPIVSGMSKRVNNKRSMDVGFIKLREFGLADAIAKRYISIRSDESSIKQINNLAIDVNRVSVLLALLCVGIAASIVIGVAENIAFNALAVRRQAGIQQKNYNRLG